MTIRHWFKRSRFECALWNIRQHHAQYRYTDRDSPYGRRVSQLRVSGVDHAYAIRLGREIVNRLFALKIPGHLPAYRCQHSVLNVTGEFNMMLSRRNWMSMAAATGATLAAGRSAVAAEAKKSIVLYCDLAVDPKREKEMLDHFHKVFAPVATKHKGYIDVKMLKLSKRIQGPELPKSINYRFQLMYENEELRLAWVASDDHAKAWPGIGNTLLEQNFQVYVFDNV